MKNLKLQFKIKKYLIFLTILILVSKTVFAAELNIFYSNKEIVVGQEIKLDIYLNSENESINAFSGEIIYPADLLELKEIFTGNSIVSLWIDQPKVLPYFDGQTQTNKNKIVFSGITPGGFNGKSGLLFSLILEAKNSSLAKISFSNLKFLLNDGLGTEAKIKTSDFNLNILERAGRIVTSTKVVLPLDTYPPEDFKPEVLNNPEMFDNKYFVIFEAVDKGRGIDHYEILEWKNKFSIFDIFYKLINPKKYDLNASSWTKAQSPYILKDQKLQSDIYVKAVDKAGNEKIAFIPAKNPIKWYENIENWIIIILGLLIVIFIFKSVKRKT
ncbi:MAG: hypothetical protein ACPL3E_01535 [Minisyncoccia bacterium]